MYSIKHPDHTEETGKAKTTQLLVSKLFYGSSLISFATGHFALNK